MTLARIALSAVADEGTMPVAAGGSASARTVLAARILGLAAEFVSSVAPMPGPQP